MRGRGAALSRRIRTACRRPSAAHIRVNQWPASHHHWTGEARNRAVKITRLAVSEARARRGQRPVRWTWLRREGISTMANNYIYGTGGNDYIKFTCTDGPDYIFAYGGSDTVHALGGDDFVMGGAGTDYIYGEGGNDYLKGGGGADHLSGGPGIDTAAYNDSPAGVTVWLFADMASGGDAAGDEFDGIENLSGSAHHDVL